MKKKKKNTYKQKPKRSKKYKGAAVQSAKDKERNYQPSIDLISNYNNKNHLLLSQLSTLNREANQNSLKNTLSDLGEMMFSLNKFESMLPKLVSPISMFDALALSRDVTKSYAKLSTQSIVSTLALQVPKETYIWSNEILKNSSTSYDLIGAGLTSADKVIIQSLMTLDIQSNFAKAATLSLFSEKSLSTFVWADIGKQIKLNESYKELLSKSFIDFSTNYSELLKSFESNPITFFDVETDVSKLIPVEFYTGANFLETISIEEEITPEEEDIKKEITYENEYSLNKYLPKVQEGLINMWYGAVETYNSNNSDKVRQFTVSIRELFTHLLHNLAPDNEIVKWTSEESYYYNGKPTRNARLQYICRNISNVPFKKFVDKDIKATIEFIDIFQKGTHSVESEFTPSQLIAIKSKAESTLKFLLEIEFNANR